MSFKALLCLFREKLSRICLFFFGFLCCFNIFYYFCSRTEKITMIQALNIQATTNNALYNKGVAYGVSAFESLNTERKIIEKKIANNLVVPNICILSLSLSLSSRADVNYTFFSSRIRAREACRKASKQRTSRSFLCSFCIILVRSIEREISQSLFDFKYLKSLISWQKNTPTGYMSSFWNR